MNTRQKHLAILILVFLLALALTAQRAPTDIIIGGADDSTVRGITSSSTLETLIAKVAPRFELQYADEMQYHEVTPVAGDLQSLLDSLVARFRLQYADQSRAHHITIPSAGLFDLLDMVHDRIVFQFADENRSYVLNYPVDLIDDQTPPQVSNIEIITIDSTAVVIRWATDEFATTEVRYGTSAGSYTQTLADSKYVKTHEVTLDNLQAGQTYYYVIRSTDQSANTFQSNERSFTVLEKSYLYLPTIIR